MAQLNKILFLAFACMIFSSTYGDITEEQMQSALKIMRDVCLPKYKSISEEVASKLKDRYFPEDRDVKCYVNCLMELMGVMKKGKFNYNATMKQIEILTPGHMKQDYINGVNACKDAAKNIKDHCESAYEMLKCFEGKMEHFYFP